MSATRQEEKQMKHTTNMVGFAGCTRCADLLEALEVSRKFLPRSHQLGIFAAIEQVDAAIRKAKEGK